MQKLLARIAQLIMFMLSQFVSEFCLCLFSVPLKCILYFLDHVEDARFRKQTSFIWFTVMTCALKIANVGSKNQSFKEST